jgi:predicted transcriptional regulator
MRTAQKSKPQQARNLTSKATMIMDDQLEARMDEIADRVARDRTNAARERTSTQEAQRPSH